VNGEMILNDAGKWCAELSNKFSDIVINTQIIIPNHFHAIVVNNGGTVGADLRVCLCTEYENQLGEHAGSPLHVVVQWFKTMTTNEYIRGVKTLNWQPFHKKVSESAIARILGVHRLTVAEFVICKSGDSLLLRRNRRTLKNLKKPKGTQIT